MQKKGISLIVLVITIIVMIILAAAVIISMSNNGIIDRAGQAVQLTDEKQVQDLASLIWAEAYLDETRTDTIENVVKDKLEEQGVTEENWNITVTDEGVKISANTKENNGSSETPSEPDSGNVSEQKQGYTVRILMYCGMMSDYYKVIYEKTDGTTTTQIIDDYYSYQSELEVTDVVKVTIWGYPSEYITMGTCKFTSNPFATGCFAQYDGVEQDLNSEGGPLVYEITEDSSASIFFHD